MIIILNDSTSIEAGSTFYQSDSDIIIQKADSATFRYDRMTYKLDSLMKEEK